MSDSERSPMRIGSQLAEVGMQLLKEKQRVSRHALTALNRYGNHDPECDALENPRLKCSCGFTRCKKEWRLAAKGID